MQNRVCNNCVIFPMVCFFSREAVRNKRNEKEEFEQVQHNYTNEIENVEN